MPVTIRDISRQTGLSYQTVANILSGSPERRAKHTAHTQTLVLDTAAALGYLPNRAARAVKTGRFAAIALILSATSNRSYLPQTLLDGILDGLTEHQLELSISRIADSAAEDREQLPRYFRERACDGLLVDFTHHVPEVLETVVESCGLANVWLNNIRPRNAVRPDDFAAGARATRLLLEAGHRRINHVQLLHGLQTGYTTDLHYSTYDRQRGFESVMREAGLFRPDCFAPDPIDPGDMPDYVAAILKRDHRPTGLVAHSDVEVLAIQLGAAKAGLRLPHDLSLVCMADIPSMRVGIDVTTVMADRHTLGKRAVELLLQCMEGNHSFPSEVVPPAVITGDSIRPPAI